MKKNRFDSKNFLHKYIAVFLIALIIPAVFGFIATEVSLHSALNEIKDKNYQSLTHIQKSFDSIFTEIKQFTIEIASGDELARFTEDPYSYNAYDISHTEFVPGTVMAREYIKDVFIYNNDRDIVINNISSMYTVNRYCEDVLNIHGQDRVDLVNIMKTPAFSEIYPAISVKFNGISGYKPYMFHAQSYPLNSDFKGNVITVLNMEKMISLFDDKFEGDDCTFFISDKTGRIIFSAGRQEYVDTSLAERAEGIGHDTLNGDSITYCVRNSAYGDFKYIFAENTADAESAVLPVRMFLYTYILIVLVLAFFAVLWLRSKGTPAEYIAEDNYGVKAAIRDIFVQQAKNTVAAENITPAQRKNFVSNIIDGSYISEAQISEVCCRTDVSFSHPYFCAVYYNLNDAKPEDTEVIKYAVSNIAGELFATVGEVFSGDSDSPAVTCVLNIVDKSASMQRQILAHLVFMHTFFKENFQTEITIGIGNIVSEAQQILASYSQAREAAEYAAVTGDKEIVAYSGMKDSGTGYSYTSETEEKLHSAVISGDIEAVRQIIDKVAMANASLSDDMSRCLFFDLTATALKIISKREINLAAVSGSINSPFERLMECKDKEEMAETVQDIFEKICNEINENHNVKKDKLKATIMDYVRDNYNNPNMSLGLVADEFEMNYTYMSHFFKDYIGSNFVDFISELRVKKAAELLRNTDMPVNEIATAVGYANATVLIKIFKKITNTTPGMYRKNVKE